MPTTHRLGRRAQVHIGDPATGMVAVGIIATNPDPADPAALLNVVDHTAGSVDTHTVRTGDVLRVAGWELTVTEVVPGSRDGHVRFTADRTGPAGGADGRSGSGDRPDSGGDDAAHR